MSRILVTGAGGQLGRELCAAQAVDNPGGDEIIGITRAELDITDPTTVRQALGAIRPDVVINAAAWTAVDACETDPARAHKANGDAVAHLREAADEVGAHLIQISTDYVFDGTAAVPYAEDANPNPLSVYGQSKLIGERNAGTDATIVRTSWVCGQYGKNMVSLVIDLMETRPELRFVTDQIGNPSFTADLVAPLLSLCRERAAGVFHLTNSTPGDAGVSWCEFVRETVEAAGGNPDMVIPIVTADLQPPRPAPRPANSVLANNKLEPLRDYREALGELVEALLASVVDGVAEAT